MLETQGREGKLQQLGKLDVVESINSLRSSVTRTIWTPWFVHVERLKRVKRRPIQQSRTRWHCGAPRELLDIPGPHISAEFPLQNKLVDAVVDRFNRERVFWGIEVFWPKWQFQLVW